MTTQPGSSLLTPETPTPLIARSKSEKSDVWHYGVGMLQPAESSRTDIATETQAPSELFLEVRLVTLSEFHNQTGASLDFKAELVIFCAFPDTLAKRSDKTSLGSTGAFNQRWNVAPRTGIWGLGQSRIRNVSRKAVEPVFWSSRHLMRHVGACRLTNQTRTLMSQWAIAFVPP